MAASKLTLANMAPKKMPRYQQAALMRLQLFVLGMTHEWLYQVTTAARAVLEKAAGDDGIFDAGEMFRAQTEIYSAWGKFFHDWTLLMNRAMVQAASIPFGTLAVYHREYLSPYPSPKGEGRQAPEGRGRREMSEGYSVSTSVFRPQLDVVVDAANNRIYRDGLRLSGRIWRLDRVARDGINQVLMRGVMDGQSAWQIAQALEQYLGAGADCPRWTSTRLYKLTKAQIAAGDRRGLKTGADCQGQGVAYNALRLARTEIQAVHHMASDMISQRSPWVEKEQVVLSPAHPKPDICDDVIAAGEGGRGIYTKGTIQLPLHPHCLCYKVQVLMDPDEFADQLGAWVRGEQSWGAMDQYAQFLGMDPKNLGKIDLIEDAIGLALVTWLTGGKADLMGVMGL